MRNIDTLIAKHENEIRIWVEPHFPTTLVICIPYQLFDTQIEHLENGRKLTITKCAFLDGYLGVSSGSGSLENALATLESVFAKLVQANTFYQYLKDKGFQVRRPTLKGFESFSIKCHADPRTYAHLKDKDA
jgi:hypothetical protein